MSKTEEKTPFRFEFDGEKAPKDAPQKYVLMHDVRHSGKALGRGDIVEVPPSHVKKVDPEGHVFFTPEKYAAKMKLTEAQAEVAKLEKADEPKKGGK